MEGGRGGESGRKEGRHGARKAGREGRSVGWGIINYAAIILSIIPMVNYCCISNHG